MFHNYGKFEVKPMTTAFSYAKAGLGANVVTSNMTHDWEGEKLILKKLKDMGQTQAINLTHKYAEAAVSLALYTGNGIVTKIIPGHFYEQEPPVHIMPPVTSDMVQTDSRWYFVNTYPWLGSGSVTQTDVEVMRTTMSNLGFSFSNGDDRPDNIRRLPDATGTLVGIDADMMLGSGNERHASLKEAWQNYLEMLYPRLYRDRDIPIQDADTNFSFTSPHDPNSRLIAFNAMQEDPILIDDEEPVKKRSFFGRWFSGIDHPGPQGPLH